MMILSSLILIAAFTAVQLNNQSRRAMEFNGYRAKLGAILLKEKIDQLYTRMVSVPQEAELFPYVQGILKEVLDFGTIESAGLLDSEGKTLVFEGNPLLQNDDAIGFNSALLARENDSSKWLLTYVDKRTRTFHLYVFFKNSFNHTAVLSFSLSNIQKSLNEVYGLIAVIVFLVVVVNFILSIFLSRMLVEPVKLLNRASRDVANGNLDEKIDIETGDELEELADTFNYMTTQLVRMKEQALNANPLTKLPGNIVIMEQVNKRISGNIKFVFIYADLDNFKAFNDKYGVHSGDLAIMLTAQIFKEAVSAKGLPEDFVGHEGGDDFLILTTMERTGPITEYITSQFDKRVREFYSKEDLDKGFIEAKSRSGEVKQFPIMTISLAGVNNTTRDISSYAELTNIAAEVKKGAKNMQVKGSRFLMDRRTNREGP
jgi:diguanylate cyclase (GGDEF)-like protein